MIFFGGTRFAAGPTGLGDERLDRPISNSDVAGIPTGAWSSSLYGCFGNIIPSCFLSFFCPCIMFSQVVIRSQIPMLIGIKNSLYCCRRKTGYGFFIDVFFWTSALILGCILILVLVKEFPIYTNALMVVILIITLPAFLYIIGHVRTAFKVIIREFFLLLSD